VLAGYRSDPEVARYQSWDAPFPLLRAETAVANFMASDPGRPGWFQYAIERIADKALIGDVAVHLHDNLMQAEIGFTLATETSPGSLTFTTQQVTTVLSDPTRDDRWFSGTTINAAFPHPTSFIGDYNGIAAGPNGIATLWTDLRAQVTFGGRSGSGSNAEFALVH